MYTLGISCYYHDASAALLKDGKVVAAVEEERFTRRKHDTSFPVKAIEYCLESQGITIDKIDHIGFYEKPLLKFERILFQHLEMFPLSLKTFLNSIPLWINQKLRVMKQIRKLKYKRDVLFIEHHMAHAASAFLVSPFEKAAIVTIDGVGEWTTTAYGVGDGNNIHLLKDIEFPHSLGLLYSTITAYLGMSVNNSEYKCLHPDTTVLLSNGNLEKIENLFNLTGKKTKISNTEEINKLKSKIELLSLDKQTLKLEPQKTNIVYRKKADTFLYEIELLSGRKVTVTLNHKFTNIDSSGDMYNTEAGNLKKGDFVIVPRKTEFRHIKSKHKYWAKLLAYSIAEGHELVRENKHEAEIRIGTTSPELLQHIKKTTHLLNKGYRIWKSRKNMYHIGVSVWKDCSFLKSMGYQFGGKADSKQVPGFVMSSDDTIKKEFLSSLFDCDGSFTGHQVIYATKSKDLANQIIYLLLGFGIHSRIRKKFSTIYNTHHYRIELSGKDLSIFQEKIGFNLKSKKEKMSKYVDSITHFGNNADFFPINDLILKKWISKGYTKKSLYTNTKHHFWDYKTGKRHATCCLLKRLNRILKDPEINKYLDSDVYFDKVKYIKKTRFKGFVYDVLMPKHHTFIGGLGGIVLHNTMGLSPFGDMDAKTNPYYSKLRKVINIKEDGSYMFDLSYFVFHFADRMPSKKLCSLLGGAVRKPEEDVTQRHKDIAAALQLVYEEALFKILKHAYEVTKCPNLVIAGGCGLNSVANGKILRNTPFEKIWIQPNSSDGGTSIGAASFVYNTLLGNKRNYVMKDAYLGPSYDSAYIKQFLDDNEIKYSTFKTEKELLKKTAKLIFENIVVGWFQGRMEWGPRALGSRSILANPCNPDAQELLNAKVKHREKFRPFAPVVCEDDALSYFDCDKPVPEPTDYMLMVYPVKEEWRNKIPSVTHVDGSGRLQTIRRDQNPLYYDLIKHFGKLSGIPILINTSFNIRGEPIVCTPEDAYKCMMGTGIDYLVIDNFLIKRSDNKKDMWDSESLAKD